MFGIAETDELTELDALEAAIDRMQVSTDVHDIAVLRRLMDRMESVWVTNVRRYERRGDWIAEGYLNAGCAIRDKCRVAPGVASATVRLARKLETLPNTAHAFAAGEISRRHVEVIADACTPAREHAVFAAEDEIIEAARHALPHEFGGAIRQFTDALDGDGGAATDAAQLERERLHISPMLDGMYALDGLATGETAEHIKVSVDLMMGRDDHRFDSRPRSRREMEALGEVCREWRLLQHTAPVRRDRAHFTVVADLSELEDRVPDAVRMARAETAHGHQLSRATLERLLCDCRMSRIITDPPSAILDVGYPAATVPDPIWRALVARDRHCTHPRCDRPPSWCDAHHVVHRSNGGATALHNLVLLCRRHHRARHLEEAHRRR